MTQVPEEVSRFDARTRDSTLPSLPGVQAVGARRHSSFDAGEVSLKPCDPNFSHSAFHVPFLSVRDGRTNAHRAQCFIF
jgi:hypothetical protein